MCTIGPARCLPVIDLPDLETLDAEQLRQAVRHLAQQVKFNKALIDKLTHENALLKRLKFAAHSERYTPEQRSLLEDEIEADLAAVALEIEQLAPSQAPQERRQPKRLPLPANLPRREIRHEPESTTCRCGCRMLRIGEDCAQCETIIQAPVAPHIIDKGIPTVSLLAQVLVAKYADHLPLYRQEAIFARAGLAIPRSTLAQWVGTCGVRLQPSVEALRAELLTHRVLHADETPVAMLKPGAGKTHRAYLWAYASGTFEDMKAVAYDFCESRSGEHARQFLGDWTGSLVCDEFNGYKALMAAGVTEVGCMAHARRKFFDLHATGKSQIAETALAQFGKVYDIEREIRDATTDERRAARQQRTRPIIDALHQWMTLQRQSVPGNSATAKALDYSLRRWQALTRFVDDGQLPVDNNWIENQIRPIAIGRNNWLFAGSLRAGQRAAAVMSRVQSARMNGHDPYQYLKDVLTRLPTHKASRIGELLPHRWQPGQNT